MPNTPHQLVITTFTLASLFICQGLASAHFPYEEVEAFLHDDVATIENSWIRIDYDLIKGTFGAFDKKDKKTCFSNACFKLNGLSSSDAGVKSLFATDPVRDELGQGRKLIITCKKTGRPDLLFEVVLYESSCFIVLGAGIHNTTDRAWRLKRIVPLAGGRAFPGFDLTKHFSMLDGHGGAQPTAVIHGPYLHSRNNILVTFGPPGANRSLVMGGLTYQDFEKFACAGQLDFRRKELEKRSRTGALLCYLDLPEDLSDGKEDGPALFCVQGNPWTFDAKPEKTWSECGTVVFHDKELIFRADRLDPKKTYQLGFSWWDFDNNGRVESVSVGGGEGSPRKVLLEKQPLPAWREKKEPPCEYRINLPPSAYSSGEMLIFVSNEANVPNAVVSEIWLLEIRESAKEVYGRPVVMDHECPPASLDVQLWAEDPVGKKVDGGSVYFPGDRFYIDFMTDNPFEALEQYGRSLREAQKIDLNVYDFPTVCLWYAEVYGKGQASNDTPGAVAEMEKIAKTGFLNYSRVAVRLVPDSYKAINQQGWWDDEHWRRGRDDPKWGNGQYKEPFETTRKWGAAVTRLGGIPLTYFQTSFRSEDYAESFPEHMLFNKSLAVKLDTSGKPYSYQPDKMNAWQRNRVLHGYDFTDPGFLEHLREVYENLRAGGVKGLMFDYPYSGWADSGGMEDTYATTASAYRNIFRMAGEGLGPDCYIHERNLARGSDITLGLVASQRTWGDTDLINPRMVSFPGLRWYKNRVVVHYDMDAKSVLKAVPDNRDGVRQMLTMAYVASGRLLLGTSFGNLSKEHLFDLARIFPFHSTPRSARPLDAFTSEFPRIYDFVVSPAWHQLTFYNQETEASVIGVDLAGDSAFGAVGLDPNSCYYVYDFWNDRLVGKLPGTSRLEQRLRPGEARMMSIHRVIDRPQFLSTNRHVMQGYLELRDISWDADSMQLQGTASVVGGEPFQVILANNGFYPLNAVARDAKAGIDSIPGEGDLSKLCIEKADNGEVLWTVKFESRR